MIARRLTTAARALGLYAAGLAHTLASYFPSACTGKCNQGHGPCACGRQQQQQAAAPSWATTSDPADHQPGAYVPGQGGAHSSVMRLLDDGQAPAPHRQMTATDWRKEAARHPLPFTLRGFVDALLLVALVMALTGYFTANGG